MATASAIVICESAALGEAVSHALQPLPTVAIRLEPLSELEQPVDHPTLLLVIALRGDAALKAIHTAKDRWPGCPTLVVGISNEEDVILACVAAGADGVVASSEGFSELKAAIDSVILGNLRVPGQHLRRFLNRFVQTDSRKRNAIDSSRIVRLSLREKEILKWIAAGQSNKEIANRLGIAEQTVKNHVGRVLHKLGVHSRFDAARLASSPGS